MKLRILVIMVFVLVLVTGGVVVVLAIQKPEIQEVNHTTTAEDMQHEVLLASQRAAGEIAEVTPKVPEESCVFNTVFGEESSDSFYVFHTPQKAISGIESGLSWIKGAQLPNGGFGAGSHSAQHVTDPHAVPADPATTAVVAMAVLRTKGWDNGEWQDILDGAVSFLLSAVENSPEGSVNITDITGTQIQRKLGQNIDVVLTAQCFNNLLMVNEIKGELRSGIEDALQLCVNRIETGIDATGVMNNSGWAGVLQSSFATNALEASQVNGITVDTVKLAQTRDYQKGNVNVEDGSVKTDLGAGVVLYSVSGSSRASAKEARKARKLMEEGVKKGLFDATEVISADKLVEVGVDETEALELSTAFNVYESAKETAQDEDVQVGYGNNGGEEFLSFLQTGESLVINRDHGWKNWYTDISGKLIATQNNDGSWNGHHCITSPVFCTATCLLVLSIQNDLEELVALGE